MVSGVEETSPAGQRHYQTATAAAEARHQVKEREEHISPVEITYKKKHIQTGLSNARAAPRAGRQKGNHSLACSQAKVSVLADNETAARVRSMAEHRREAGGGQTRAVGLAEAVVPSSIRQPGPRWSLHGWAHGQSSAVCV